VTTPIGLPALTGKEPAVIAVGVAARLLEAFADERSRHTAAVQPSLETPADHAPAPDPSETTPMPARP
jgi:xanthine dehydrogenase accessory factor